MKTKFNIFLSVILILSLLLGFSGCVGTGYVGDPVIQNDNYSNNGILIANGDTAETLDTGTAGQVLTSGGDGVRPSWDSVAGTGDMTKSEYDTNDDGTVDSADSATSATTATNLSGGTVDATQIKDADLTSGRVVLATTDGQLTDDSDLSFIGDTLTATKFVGDGSGLTGISATSQTTGLVVAGNDASTDIKAGANYICDGTDDEVQILQAIAALTAERNKIEKITLVGSFSVGYTSGTGCIDVPSYTEIEIIGKITREVDCANKYLFYGTSSDNIYLHGGTIDNNIANQSGTTTSHYAMYFTGTTGEKCIIDSMSFINGRYGIKIYNRQSHITNCQFKDITAFALYIGGNGQVVDSCTFNNCTMPIELNSDNLVMTSCTFYNGCGKANLSGGGAYNTSLVNCNFIDTANGVIPLSVDGIRNISIIGCTFAGFSAAGIGLHSIEIGADVNTVLIQGCTLLGDEDGYAINIVSGAANIYILNNIMVGESITTLGVSNNTTGKVVIRGNEGYVAPGEIRTYTGTIGTLTQNAFNSLDNPFGQAVRVLNLDFYISTAAGDTTPNSTIDSGLGSSATTDYTTLFEGVDCEVIGFYNSVNSATIGKQTVPQLWASGSGNRYLNMSIKDAAATGMVCKYTVTVMGN